MAIPPASGLDFGGAVVLVTGGTKGVGRGITQRFLDAGAHVVTTARNPPAEPVTADDGRTAAFEACDVRDLEQLTALVAHVAGTHGRLDVVVNNAGGAPSAPAATASPRYSEAIIRLNLLAPLNLAQLANAVMQEQDGVGNIINIGSVSGTRPNPGSAAYGAAKAGLLNLTETLAMEWAPKVRVNCVTGGYIMTEQSELYYGDEAGVARVAATVPLGRLAEPTDIGDACLFLASPLARHVTGANLVVHGGGEPPPYLAAVGPR
jgi:NAD(P)-dependent dehydrogenase (short-subunit alcohol dehydrogenase family)